MTIETGALEQVYAKVETTFAADAVTGGETLAGTDGIRHIEVSLETKKNRRTSDEKRGTPDHFQMLPDRQSQNFNLAQIMWEPSGTLGTISNVGKFIKAGMGANHVLSLDTTVDDAVNAPTDTTATLTSATGVAVGDIGIFTVATAARREATRITVVATLDVEFDALSVAPDAPGQVTFGITYKLASNLSESLAIYKFYNAGGFSQATFGNVVDGMEITFDGTKETLIAFTGPAGRYADESSGGGTVQAKPATHVTVGSPTQGMIGNFYVDGTAFLVISVKATLANNIELRNKELGTAWASGIAGRTNHRMIKVSITFYLEDLNLIGKANSVTTGTLRLVIGQTNGAMVAAVAPKVEFEVPSIGAEIGPKEVTIEGTCLATLGNDSLVLAEV